MDVPDWVWILTVVGIAGLLLFDFVFHVRKAHIPTLKEAGGLVGGPEEARLRALPEKYRKRIREEQKLMTLLRRAHEAHDAEAGAGVGVPSTGRPSA